MLTAWGGWNNYIDSQRTRNDVKKILGTETFPTLKITISNTPSPTVTPTPYRIQSYSQPVTQNQPTYQNYGWYSHDGQSMQYVNGNWYATAQQSNQSAPTQTQSNPINIPQNSDPSITCVLSYGTYQLDQASCDQAKQQDQKTQLANQQLNQQTQQNIQNMQAAQQQGIINDQNAAKEQQCIDDKKMDGALTDTQIQELCSGAVNSISIQGPNSGPVTYYR